MGSRDDSVNSRYRRLSRDVVIDLDQLQWEAVRAAGPGGQNVNKVNTAIHLRLDLKAASLPAHVLDKLLSSGDRRISSDGVLVIKAQRFRTQRQNREDALERLLEVLSAATRVQKVRRATKPSRASIERRRKAKTFNSKNKALRRKPSLDS